MSSPREFVDDQGFGPTGPLAQASIDCQVDSNSDGERALMLAELISRVTPNKGVLQMGAKQRVAEVRGAIDEIVKKYSKGDEELAVRLRKELEKHKHHFRRVDCDQVALDVNLTHEDDGGLDEDAVKDLKGKLLCILGEGRLAIGQALSKSESDALDASFHSWMERTR